MQTNIIIRRRGESQIRAVSANVMPCVCLPNWPQEDSSNEEALYFF